jgi:predicted MarR family transcription regulator
MSLDSLLAMLEKRNVTPVTTSASAGVTSKPKQIKDCTLVTSVTADFTEAEIEQYEERAAIMEFDGGLSREEAEKLAAQEIYRLRIAL